MNELVLANRAADWRRLKMLVLDSVSSPITKRVYNLGLDDFFEWFGREPRPGFTKATVSAWRWRPAGLARFRSTCASRPCANWRSRPPTTDCWRRNWPLGSRALKASSPRACGLGTGYQCVRPRRF